MIIQIDVRLVGFPVLVQRSDPIIEQLLNVQPLLRRHPIRERVHQALQVQVLRHGLDPKRRRGVVGEAQGNEGMGEGRVAVVGRVRVRVRVRASPVLVIEGASGGRVRWEGRRRRFRFRWRRRRKGRVLFVGYLGLLG